MFVDMLEFLFGWTKASKCKKLIRYVQCRLRLLKNKRESIIRQIREVIVQLIQNGHDDKAFSRVEQLIKDQNMKDVYDLLDHFCELIIIRLAYIWRHRDCPSDISEAVSSLIYASARFGDLPELIKLRTLFGKRYGNNRVTDAVELLSENHVNHVMIEKLSMKSVSDDVKFRVLREIARENNLQLRPPDMGCGLTLQYCQAHDSEKQVPDGNYGKDNCSITCSPSNGLEITLCESDNRSDTTDNFVGALTVVQSSPDDNVPLSRDLDCRSLIRVEPQAQPFSPSDQNDCRSRSYAAPLLQKMETVRRNTTRYIDIQEFQNCETEDIKSPDRRVFMFKLTFPSVRCKSNANGEGVPCSFLARHKVDAIQEKASSRAARKKRKSVGKRWMSRYGSAESLVHIYSMLFFSRYLCIDNKCYPGSPFTRGTIRHPLTEISYCNSRNGESEGHCRSHLSRNKHAALSSTGKRIRSGRRTSEIVQCSTEIVPWKQTGPERSSSSCSHIHPKLPDYDDLVSKFMALKLDHMQGSKR